jgi:hypothetical protein
LRAQLMELREATDVERAAVAQNLFA